MATNIRNRLIVIALLILGSAIALFPRNVETRVRDSATGVYRTDTIRRVPLKKGLDLAGGIHLSLEIDESRGAVADKNEAIERALTVVRNRIDQFGVSEPVVQKEGTERIIVELPGEQDIERAEKLVKEAAFLQFQITDETRALDRVLPRVDHILRELGEGGTRAGGALGDTAKKEPGAIAGLFSKDSSADTSKAGRDSAAKQDSAQADTGFLASTDGPLSKLLQPGGTPGEFFVAKENVGSVQRYLSLPQVKAVLPPGKVIRWASMDEETGGPSGQFFYVLDANPIITGDYLIDARPAQDPMEGTVVTFRLNQTGARRFGRETQRHIQDYMAIVLDSIVMGRPPVIQSQIRDNGQITMKGRPLQAAQDLALVLRAGALPVPLKVVEAQTIGPSVGADSVKAGIQAVLLGIVLVIAFVIVYYRFSGMLAVGALVLYGLFTLAMLAFFGATLTLPGIAGFVLSVGMAVDANVLIFERIREELEHGRTVRAAIDGGFQNAMSAIIDSNVTTALTALILYQLGTGPVKGFAVTLLAGLAASMVSAIFVTRTFFLMWLNRTRGAQTLSI